MAVGAKVGAVIDCVNEVLRSRRIPIDPITESLSDKNFTIEIMPLFHAAVQTCLRRKGFTYTYPLAPTGQYMTRTFILALRELYVEISGRTQAGVLAGAAAARAGIAVPKAKKAKKAKKAAKKAVKKAAKKARKPKKKAAKKRS